MTCLSESREEAEGLNPPLANPKSVFIIGNWNVRTMYALGKAAQVAEEMKNQQIQILGISESRWNGSGKTRLTTGETVLYSGRDDDNHIHGVAIMLSKEAATALIDWSAINERIISARFYSRHVKLTVIHAYAPTNDTDETLKDSFYELLQETVQKTHKHDLLIITGDFNAKVGKEPEPYKDVMGKYGQQLWSYKRPRENSKTKEF